jgi:Ca2+-binding RTX toxin-like protein
MHLIRKLAILSLGVLVWGSMITAMAASNTVPSTKLSSTTRPITPQDLAPDECKTYLTLTSKVAVSGNYTGTTASELIVGGPSAQTIRGGGGDDCILGGGGDDDLRGEAGIDFIYGGPGNDTINGGPDTDVCYGGTGTDTFANCEYQFDP